MLTCSDPLEHERTLLHAAFDRRSAYEDVVKLLIQAGVADASFQGDWVIHRAVREGYNIIAQLLIKHNSTLLNQTNIQGKTPLHVAAETKNVGFVRICCMNNADKTLLAQDEDILPYPYTVVDYVQANNIEAMIYLLAGNYRREVPVHSVTMVPGAIFYRGGSNAVIVDSDNVTKSNDLASGKAKVL